VRTVDRVMSEAREGCLNTGKAHESDSPPLSGGPGIPVPATTSWDHVYTAATEICEESAND
jgi:hypothetical protein